MNDGDRELLASLNAEATEDEYARAITCQCGARFWEFEDMDAHRREDCEAAEVEAA